MLSKIKHHVTSLLDSVNPVASFQFPPEFDPDIYRTLHQQLYNGDIQYSAEELCTHYRNYGIKEGRRANLLKTRVDFIKLIPKNKKILEVGPFFNPLTSGKNVSYFDILDRDNLILRAQSLGFSTKTSKFPKIHFVSPTGDLSIINEKFDVILSSHCIEHQANLIKHFSSVEKLLNPGGFYFLLIPDKRYCFDHFIPESNLAQIIEAHIENRTIHSLRSVLEHRVLTSHNESLKHWNGQHGEIYSSIKERVENALTEHKESLGTYIDVHAWYFVPDSFKNIIHALNELSYTQLNIERVYNTLYGNNEFWVILKKP